MIPYGDRRGQGKQKEFHFLDLMEERQMVSIIELTFVSRGRPRRLKRFLFLIFFLVLMMSSSLILAFSLALIRSALAVDWSWVTWVRNSDSTSPLSPSWLVSPSRFIAARGTMIWETRLEMLDLTMSSLARAAISSWSSDDSSSLANSFTKQIWKECYKSGPILFDDDLYDLWYCTLHRIYLHFGN